MALAAVFKGGPFDGHEEHLDELPSVITFDHLASWPGDMVASSLPAEQAPPVRYRRNGEVSDGRRVYEYVPLEPA